MRGLIPATNADIDETELLIRLHWGAGGIKESRYDEHLV